MEASLALECSMAFHPQPLFGTGLGSTWNGQGQCAGRAEEGGERRNCDVRPQG